MEEAPKFIKEFSKEQNADQRAELVRDIWTTRNQKKAEKQQDLENLENQKQEGGRLESEKSEHVREINELENKITDLSSNGVKRIANYFKLRKLRADFSAGQKSGEELEKSFQGTKEKTGEITAKLEKETAPPGHEEAHQMLAEFYKGQKEKWVKSDYSPEDIQKHFSEENLASLSMEDYTTLLKRFPNKMVTHVTRQGIRDHYGMEEHSVGLNEHWDGFRKLTEDGHLKSHFAIALTQEEEKKAIANFLKLDQVGPGENDFGPTTAKEEAIRRLNDIFKRDLPDYSAVHLATEEVADAYYGAEKGNEIFIAFPSAMIASQYHFEGQLTKPGATMHNDQWIWANEEKGININCGVIFIPANAKVDRVNGSKYQLDANKKPIKKEGERSPDEPAFELAKETISSKDYWEDYFAKNPGKRPSKIVYYSGENPTAALLKWKEENGITKNIKEDEREHLGFKERQISSTQYLQSNIEKSNRFISIGQEVIEEYYEDRKSA